MLTVSEPHPRVEVLLPGNGGVIKGRVKVIMQTPTRDVWVKVTVPTWNRWRTQVEVGQPAHEGIAPGEQDMWVPGFAVTGDEDDIRKLQRQHWERASKTSA
jgi:hypothetical protein